MKRALLLSFLAAAALGLASPASQAPTTVSPELQKLDISTGRWVYHGTATSRSGKISQWTWNEDCSWSANHLFLECSFNNIWAGRPAESLVVDTYNRTDHTYWHYEMFAGGQDGAHPYVSTMQIQGDTWTEQAAAPPTGKSPAERIVYHWESPQRVSVAIQTSTDGANWTTVDQGVGLKQPD